MLSPLASPVSPMVTSLSQLSVGHNFILHKFNINMSSCNYKLIKIVLSLKYLEVTIDFDLKLSEHIQNIKKKQGG